MGINSPRSFFFFYKFTHFKLHGFKYLFYYTQVNVSFIQRTRMARFTGHDRTNHYTFYDILLKLSHITDKHEDVIVEKYATTSSII